MTIKASSLGGGGSLPRLAPDLTYPAAKVNAILTHISLIVPVVAGVETTTLNLTGKWIVNRLWYTSLTSEVMTHYMENDGVPIWNDDGVAGTTFALYGYDGSGLIGDTGFEVVSDLTLKITTISDTSVTINFLARPVL